MSSVTIRVGAEQHTDPTFSWWELYGSQTNHALADVIANAEFDTFFFGRHAHHVNLTIGDTWHYWARAAYDRGATFTALTYLGSITITGAGEHMPAWTIKMRNAASTGTPHNVDFNDLTEEASPAAGDKIPGWLASGELRMFDVGNMPSSGSGGGASGGGEQTIVAPQVRLTLTTGTPVMTTSVTGATTVYCTPRHGQNVPLWNGSSFEMHDIGGELSQATTDSTKSPAACVAHSNYDKFVWLDAGTYRCTRGPRWIRAQTFTVTIATPAVFTQTAHGHKEGDPIVPTTSGALPTGLTSGTVYFVSATGLAADTYQVSTTVGGASVNTSGSQSGVHTMTDSNRTRGTGAGTTELETVDGLLVNKNSITNGPVAREGTYVGTIRTNASSQVDMVFGGTGAAGGESPTCHVWNAYNRIRKDFKSFDNTDTWTYTTDAYRLKNAAGSTTANRFLFINGVREGSLHAVNSTLSRNSSANIGRESAVGHNSTVTAVVGGGHPTTAVAGANATVQMIALLDTCPDIGCGYVAPLEKSGTTGLCTWIGDAGTTTVYSIFTITYEW